MSCEPRRPSITFITESGNVGMTTVGRGDLVLVRTGQYARALREGWVTSRRRRSRPVVHHGRLAAPNRDCRHCHRHLGLRSAPDEFDNAFQPLHQVAIRHLGLLIGEMWALEELADDCAANGVSLAGRALARDDPRRGAVRLARTCACGPRGGDQHAAARRVPRLRRAAKSLFALERHLDVVARPLGLAPEELRRRNFVHQGQTLSTGQVVRDEVDMEELMARALELSD